jgi:hypothetical protein
MLESLVLKTLEYPTRGLKILSTLFSRGFEKQGDFPLLLLLLRHSSRHRTYMRP